MKHSPGIVVMKVMLWSKTCFTLMTLRFKRRNCSTMKSEKGYLRCEDVQLCCQDVQVLNDFNLLGILVLSKAMIFRN